MYFLRWLIGLFFKPKLHENPRAIFEYFDGQKTVLVDPFEVWTKFREVAGDDFDSVLRRSVAEPTPGVIGKMAEVAAEKRREATKKLHEGIIAAFGVQAFDGAHGLTMAERVTLAVRFLVFMGELAQQAHPISASPLPMESSQPT